MQYSLEQQAQQTPHAIAVNDGARQWTYEQLDQRANQLAHALQKHGICPNEIVGIHADRTIEFILGIFGVLKAGGTYVPLDPHYPAERLCGIVEETQPRLILAQQPLPPEWTVDCPVLNLAAVEAAIAQEPTTPPATEVSSAHLAYILYTSGSTGKPKGVQMSRGTVERYVHALKEILRLRPDDVYLHGASFSFSSSVRQLLLPLAQGAQIRLASWEETRDPLKLFALMQDARVTVWDGIASVWQYGLKTLETLDIAQQKSLTPSHLRWIITSGGPTSCALFQKIRQHLNGQPQFLNLYGQTETVGSTFYQVPADFDRQEGIMPIGHPYAYTRAYVLDEDLQPVAPGVAGELHMAGGCLAEGYFRQPDLTAAKFIPNPWVEQDGPEVPILLKTGDRVRQLSDGSFEVAGRVDFQIKIRGMRVELGELEACLEQHPLLKDAVVVARLLTDRDDEKQLVAYCVPQQQVSQVNTADLTATLRQHMGDRLPDYMVPSHFVFLEALPLTPNGKRDRQALPDPAIAQPQNQRPIIAPKDDLEVQLRDIWKAVLNLDVVSTTDSFFDLGGHSLLAAQLFTCIEQISGIRLPLATLVTAPSIAQLAEVLRQQPDALWPCLVPIQPLDTTTHLFCVHGIFGNVMNFVELARSLGSGYSVYGLQARGLDGKQPPFDQVEAMAAHYVQEIQSVQPDGPYYLVGYSFGGNVALEIAHQLMQQGEEVAQVILLDSVGRQLFRQVPLLEKLQHHTRFLLRQGPTYLLDKLRGRFHAAQNDGGSSHSIGAIFGISDQPEGTTGYSAESMVVSAAHRHAQATYDPRPYPGKVVLIRAQIPDPDGAWYIDPLLGWGHVVTGPLTVYHSSGYHVSMLTPPYVDELAAFLKPDLPFQQTTREVLVSAAERR